MIPLDFLENNSPEDSDTVNLVISGFRVLRLFRLWRIFRILRLIDIYSNNNSFSYANRLGKQIQTYFSMKTGCIIIIIASAMTIIDYDTPFTGAEMGIEMLETLPLFSAAFNITLTAFTESYPIIYMTMYNITVFNNGETIDIGGIDQQQFRTSRTYAVMDISELVKGQSIVTIILISTILFFFFILTILINTDVKKKVIKPVKVVTEKLLQVGSVLNVYKPKQIEYMYKDPHNFFIELLEKIAMKYD